MKVRVEVVCLNADGDEQRRQVLTIERRELAMETLGMNLSESKTLLACVQDFVVAQQAREELEQRRACPHCRRRYTTKDSGSTPVSTVFGRVEVLNPRWNRCGCQTEGPQTFRPMRSWLNGQTSPEMLYLETKWASLIPFARATDLLKEVLPVGDLVNAETVRNHLQLTAERIEQELGEERQLNRFEGSEQEWERQPLPDGPITVGIDGGYVRAAHKQGWFEVIAGKSVVAFRRDDEGEVPSAKCFGFVQTYDEKPRRRLWELMKSQGMQENQQVVFMSDGGENVRRVQEYLHPFSEHLIDWFHITMRLTVLQQQTKALQEERPETGAGVSKRLESLKHLLWHGNTEEALERLGDLLMELSLIESGRTLRRRSSTASMTLEHTSAITASSSRTSASVDGKGKRFARHSWSRRSIKWSADDSSRSSRCSGRCAGLIFCCRPGRGSSTRIWTTYSAVGIQNSGRNHKRRSQSARRLDPRLFGALFAGGLASKCERFEPRRIPV